jgi:hypothetical protein
MSSSVTALGRRFRSLDEKHVSAVTPRHHVNAIYLTLDDFYDLLSKVLAAQQPEESFGHALDPIQHIFLEFDLSRRCQLESRCRASSRLCHQSNTRNPWMLARVTMS